MADILPFKTKVDGDGEEPYDPHLSGPFFCGACGHEWEGVASVGETHVTCPKCNRFWGAAKHVVEPETRWRCNCGETLFWLTPGGALCRRCGATQTNW